MGNGKHRGREAADQPEGKRVGEPALLRLEAFLERRSPGFVILLGLLLLALTSLVDAVTGSFDVSVFYFVPMGLVTFSRGRWMGALMAGVATVARSAAEIARGVTTLDNPVTYWSAITRFYVFMAVVLLIGPVRDALVSQRALAAREAETADQLRAMNELRDALQHEDMPDAREVAALSELTDSLARLDGPPVVSSS